VKERTDVDHSKRSAAEALLLIEQVNDDRTVVEIVSRRGSAVLMSADDYAALEETAYLLRSPENVRRLLTA
jgi:antitoxin YefM